MTARRSLCVGGARHGDVVDTDDDLPAAFVARDDDGGDVRYVAVVIDDDDVAGDLEAHGFDQVVVSEDLARKLDGAEAGPGELLHQTIDADRTAGLNGEWATGEYPDD